MKHCASPARRQTTFKATLGPFARDERLPMVERVLGLLVESRYGREAELLPEFGGEIQASPEVSMDLFPVPFPIPTGRRSFGDAVRIAMFQASRNCVASMFDLTNSIVRNLVFNSPSNLGRGSPRSLLAVGDRFDIHPAHFV
ncbi:MAG: hypothetical protein ABL999_01435 [Pyrinomonadaceae bacterium]